MKKTANDLSRHAVMRAQQRYGLTLYEADLAKIVSDIKGKKSKFIKKQSNTRSWHLVVLGEQELLVVYDKVRSAILTVLPEECREEI